MYLSQLIINSRSILKSANSINEISINEVFIHGMITEKNNKRKEKIIRLDSAVVEVFDISKKVFFLKTFTNKSGAFFLKIPMNSIYEIKFQKNGLNEEKIMIDSNVDKKFNKQYHLFIDVELDHKKKLIDNNIITKIYFDKEERRFISRLSNKN